jgi:hypothetical protein
MNYDLDMPGYIQDMADWLNGNKVHPCNFDNAYAGFEVMMAMFHGVVDGGQIALPITTGRNELDELKEKMADSKLFVTLEESKKEYNC